MKIVDDRHEVVLNAVQLEKSIISAARQEAQYNSDRWGVDEIEAIMD